MNSFVRISPNSQGSNSTIYAAPSLRYCFEHWCQILETLFFLQNDPKPFLREHCTHIFWNSNFQTQNTIMHFPPWFPPLCFLFSIFHLFRHRMARHVNLLWSPSPISLNFTAFSYVYSKSNHFLPWILHSRRLHDFECVRQFAGKIFLASPCTSHLDLDVGHAAIMWKILLYNSLIVQILLTLSGKILTLLGARKSSWYSAYCHRKNPCGRISFTMEYSSHVGTD